MGQAGLVMMLLLVLGMLTNAYLCTCVTAGIFTAYIFTRRDTGQAAFKPAPRTSSRLSPTCCLCGRLEGMGGEAGSSVEGLVTCTISRLHTSETAAWESERGKGGGSTGSSACGEPAFKPWLPPVLLPL